ncbi:MAG: NUDIX domain-containing protein [Verrucomicrobia bacterium]|nr:NUDIX domain-containing protein [Verrucomicrobiota bacterium]
MDTARAPTSISKRTGAFVHAYLILRKENLILLQLRQNTGYCDGQWSFAAGKVEDNEPASSAMVREAKEELGIDICPSHLKVAHVMHRKTNQFNVDVFFDCTRWEGSLENKEMQKCAEMGFFPLDALPSPLVDYNKTALDFIAEGVLYSELGWNG